jgi:hypothetical protein
LITIAVGVGLTFLNHHLDSEEVASAVGLNLIASVLFALIFSSLHGRIQERLLLERIEGTVGGVSQELLGRLAGYDADYMPMRSYAAGQQWDKAYNRDITASLSKTVTYAFRGTSAKYIAPRLKNAPRGRLQHVQIIILDPRSDDVLEARAAIKKDQTGSPKGIRDLAEEIRNEILMSVVALFDCSDFCSPEVYFVQDVTATRVELFDDAAYISWYQGPKSADKPFPESLKFAHGTFPYLVQTQELHLRRGLPTYRMEIRRNAREADILSDMSELAGRRIELDDIRAWRIAYDRYIADFKKFLGPIR